MSRSENRKIFQTPDLMGPSRDVPDAKSAPAVQAIRADDVPMGPAPIPSFASARRAETETPVTPLPGMKRGEAPAARPPQDDGPATGPAGKTPAAPGGSPDKGPDKGPGKGPDKGPGKKPDNRSRPARKKANARNRDLSDIEVQPVAPQARVRSRHRRLIFSLVMIVILPLAVIGWYLSTRAVDQYASVAGFTVRSEDGVANTLLGGVIGGLTGTSTQSDTEILYEFIQSQSLVNRIQERFDLRALYSKHRDVDPFFAVDPDATAEELLDYWQSIVSVAYDQSSGLMEMRVQAFEPETAQAIANAVLEESQTLINDLNAQARADALRYAQIDLEEALERQKSAREALILFRTRTQIVDPETDLKGRLGVINSLQQQLAKGLIEQDLLREQGNSAEDPRMLQAGRRNDVIRDRIAQEREALSSGAVGMVQDEAYPELLAEYAALQVDQEYAEEGYRAALNSLAAAKAAASRQTLYLASYVTPTLPQTAEYPRRWLTFGLAALFLMLGWSIIALIYYSIRDSR